ncbi:MAG: efflux RND transporter periplasmic adaptor subunit [Metallibacterium scheffleri]|uniref:efflux RND transporter periplasmic adaptor subunit n=1 Tax=Metallibacterium scheffleri TaxID=993689 RepID=UPI0026F0A7F5|nr:efflux RND transporter periplasmic adaptor subunit [Metallibacterium scheffleri]MCK9368321.1 efflux RND transporter periplasmic adaptor subunit [Metallibacterium scheffleri]
MLAVQHHRHGWPFSLHHGLVTGGVIASSGTATMDASGAPAHPRVAVEFDPSQAQAIGLRLETARREVISEPLRAVATVVPDESRVSHVHTRISGWLEVLQVNTTGQSVRAGQPLASVFSQELLATQTEYLAALKDSRSGPRSAIVEGARARLKILGMSDDEVAGIERSGEPRRLVTLTAPRSGIVLRRNVSVGTAVDPSTEILTVADLSTVWVIAEVPESGMAQITRGAVATLDFTASGHPLVEAAVDFVYPTLTERTRTLRVRFAVANPGGTLRPGLYGSADFRGQPREALTLSRDAIVDTGRRQHVFVTTAPGRYEPRNVTLGARLSDRVEILAGVTEADQVVAAGVFLLDSESRLRASGAAATGHGGHTAPRAAETPQTPAEPNPHSGHGT